MSITAVEFAVEFTAAKVHADQAHTLAVKAVALSRQAADLLDQIRRAVAVTPADWRSPGGADADYLLDLAREDNHSTQKNVRYAAQTAMLAQAAADTGDRRNACYEATSTGNYTNAAAWDVESLTRLLDYLPTI